MKAQDIDLSPRNILKYLVDLEKRLPRREYKEYKAVVLVKSPVTEEMLNREARLMLDFVGLTHCTPRCLLCDVEEGTGGSINLNDDAVVRINVSKEFINNHVAAVAVLAHEICHKLLYTYKIYFPNINVINEVYTDLCTIYVGFGQLVLNGYITKSAKTTHYLGYLRFDVYKSTFAIIKATKDNYNNIKTDEIEDYYIQMTVEYLQSHPNLRASFLEGFKRQQHTIALLNRNIAVFNGLITQMQQKTNLDLSFLSDCFFENRNLFDENGEPLLPLHIFSVLYETMLKLDTDDLYLSETKTAEVLDELIVKLIDCNKDLDVSNYDVFSYKCPICGVAVDGKKYRNRSTILKCPNCRKYFYLNCEEFSVVGTRKRIKAKEETLIRSLVAKDINAVREDAYRRGAENAKNECKQQFKEKIDSLPSWFRWLVKMYIS